MANACHGALLTWTDVADRDEPAFNEWYDREHLGERLAMPGFRRVRRYRAITGGPRYLAIYDTTDVSDLASPAYQRLLREQSAESRRIMSRFTTLHRLTCRRSIQCGSLGFGGTMGVLCFFPATGEDDATRRHLDEFRQRSSCVRASSALASGRTISPSPTGPPNRRSSRSIIPRGRSGSSMWKARRTGPRCTRPES